MAAGRRFSRGPDERQKRRVWQGAVISVIVVVVCADPSAQLTGDREQRVTLFTRYLESLRIQAVVEMNSNAVGLTDVVQRSSVVWFRGGPGRLRTTTRRVPLSFLESESSEPALDLLPTCGWQ